MLCIGAWDLGGVVDAARAARGQAARGHAGVVCYMMQQKTLAVQLAHAGFAVVVALAYVLGGRNIQSRRHCHVHQLE